MINMQSVNNFTPEVQEQLIRNGIYGRDITNGIPKPQVDPNQIERTKTLENIYNMVQNGELVPRANVQYQQPVAQNVQQTQTQYVQPVVQNAPVNNVQNDNVSSDNSKDNSDLLELLGMSQPSVQQNNTVNNQQYNVSNNGNTQENNPRGQQVINWEDTIIQHQQLLRTEAAKQGINGDEVLKWIENLSHADYIEAFKASRPTHVQQQPVQQQTTGNPNLIDWTASRQRLAPSIVDIGDSYESVYANNSNEKNNHPFGLNANGLRY